MGEDFDMKTTHRRGNLVGGQPFAARSARSRGASPLALVALSLAAAGACNNSTPSSTVSQTSETLTQSVLGTAQSFAVLAGSTVTNTGPTTVAGNLGVDPGLAVTGFPPGLVASGSIHAGDAVALQAQNDTATAYNTLAGEALTVDLTGQDLGGMTLVAGVYHFSSSAQLTGRLSLDGQGDPNAAFVFQVGSTLTTASNSSVAVLNGATDCNIFWQVGSSATLGTTSAFKGNIIALASITLNTGATVGGRTLARNAAVTMDTNDVSPQSCATSVDAGVDEAIGSSDANLETGSSGGSDGALNSDSGTASGSSGISGSSSGSGGSGSGSSSGAEAGVDGGADASEAGGNLCCVGVLCGTSCTNLGGDNANCGSCGNVCASDQSCVGGVCQACSPVCAGMCTDLGSDHANCGACGNACAPGDACVSGACVCP
jgi:hypothetical protein